jgi:arabinogalactan endo-1,4-beta-galactosidase
VSIETNVQGQPVDLILPLPSDAIPADAEKRAAWLANLVIYIEHSDGEKELVQPELALYADGQQGLQFTVTKFSTFAVLSMDNWSAYNESNQPHESYITGYTDGEFKPERAISRAEMAALLARVVAGERERGEQVSYADRNDFGWAAPAIDDVSSAGLMSGYADGTFGPDQALTRAEAAAIVARWKGLTGERTAELPFADTSGHWSERDIGLVVEAGYMKGMPDGSFQPDKPLTRAEAVTLFNRVLARAQSVEAVTPTWTDVAPDHWAFQAIESASR